MATSASASAIDELSLKYEKSYANVLSADNASLNAIVETGDDGTSFTAGCFDTAFSGLEPVAVSAFVMKNDAKMEPTWKVALQGSATVSAMVSDNQGGVFVAGYLADEVVLGSTDGNTKTIAGYQEWGAYSEDQVASFVAHYDSNGKLLAANTLLPTNDPAIDAAVASNPDGFFVGYNECFINGLAYEDNQLYATILFSGQISTTDEASSICSGSADAYGMGFFMSNRAGAVATLDESLNFTSFPVTVATRPLSEGTDAIENVSSIKMDVDNGHAYVAFIGQGKVAVTTSSKTTIMDYSLSEEGYVFGYGIVDVQLSDGAIINKQSNEVATTYEYISTRINDVEVAGDRIVVSGVFQTNLGFSPSLTAVGGCDLFVAFFSKDNLEVTKAVGSGFDEGEVNSNSESMLSAAVVGNVVYVSGVHKNKSDGSAIAPLYYAVEIDGNEMTKHYTTEYISDIASSSDSTCVYFATSPAPFTDAKFSIYEAASTGIESVSAANVESARIFDLSGRRIEGTPKNGLYIKDGKKLLAR